MDQKKSSLLILIHLAYLNMQPGCQKQQTGGRKERLEEINIQREKHSVESGSEGRQRARGNYRYWEEAEEDKLDNIEGAGWGQRQGGAKTKRYKETKKRQNRMIGSQRRIGQR